MPLSVLYFRCQLDALGALAAAIRGWDMTKIEFDELLRSLDFDEPVNPISMSDGLQVDWSQDGRLKSLRLMSDGQVKGWRIDNAEQESLAGVCRVENLSFTVERQRDEFGEPEETLQQWQCRWITVIIRGAQNQLVCSFCSKTSKQSKMMVPGRQGALICDECVRLIGAIMNEQT